MFLTCLSVWLAACLHVCQSVCVCVCFSFFLSHTLLNNSITVKARATKFKTPRPILPGKCSILALCDLAPLPGIGLTPSRRRPIKEIWGVPFFSKFRYSGNNSRNCTIFGAQEELGDPFNVSYFDLGVTSRDLSMT